MGPPIAFAAARAIGPISSSFGQRTAERFGGLVDAWLWGPALASLLAPMAAAWRVWAGWTVWSLALLAAAGGYLFVAAGTVLLGLFALLIGFSPDWGAATASFGAPAVLSSAVLAGTWHLTRRVAGRSGRSSPAP